MMEEEAAAEAADGSRESSELSSVPVSNLGGGRDSPDPADIRMQREGGMDIENVSDYKPNESGRVCEKSEEEEGGCLNMNDQTMKNEAIWTKTYMMPAKMKVTGKTRKMKRTKRTTMIKTTMTFQNSWK